MSKNKSSQTTNDGVSRRNFLKQAGTLAAGITIVPSTVIAGLGHKSAQ